MPALLYRVATIALAGVIAGGVHSFIHEPLKLRPDAPLPPPHPPATDAHPASPHAALGLEISIDESWALFQAGTPFIDARRLEDYTAGHVEGAFWIAPEAFLRGVPEALNFLDPNGQVVIYCSGGNCDASHNLATLLQQAGFTRCHIMKDGYPVWAAAGRPTATGQPTIGAPP